MPKVTSQFEKIPVEGKPPFWISKCGACDYQTPTYMTRGEAARPMFLHQRRAHGRMDW